MTQIQLNTLEARYLYNLIMLGSAHTVNLTAKETLSLLAKLQSASEEPDPEATEERMP